MPNAMGNLTEDLLALGMTLRETHISRVFLADERVYKLKKPVQLGFLDFSTLAQRKHFCEVEVELNRRLADDVYLGVVPITREAGGVHRLGGEGEPVDYAVEMRRLSDANAADVRLREGQLSAADVTRIAERVAAFHAAARCDAETAQYGSAAAIETNVVENFEQTRESAQAFLAAPELAAIERWQRGFLQRERARFALRVTQGRIRDGHGDLRLEH
ncbi:MAG: kinase, partial [Polyangiales bacterium]